MIEGYFGLFAAITGGIVGVVGAVFTVRSSLIKSNLEAMKELLSTVTTQRDTAEEASDKYRKERDEALQMVAQLQGETKTLREIATQTPEILELTKSVSENTKQMGTVAKQIVRLTATVEKHFNEVK